MEEVLSTDTVTIDQNRRISDTIAREQARLRRFIRKHVRDDGDAEDIFQEVFYELVDAYRLMKPVEQVGAWLFRERATGSSTCSLPRPALSGNDRRSRRKMARHISGRTCSHLPKPDPKLLMRAACSWKNWTRRSRTCLRISATYLSRMK